MYNLAMYNVPIYLQFNNLTIYSTIAVVELILNF